MRGAILVAAAMVLAGCASGESRPAPTAAERDHALAELYLCFRDHLAEYDDGVSPAPLVAKAVTQSACQEQARAFGEVQTATVPRSFGQPVRDWIMNGGPLVDQVLAERAKQRKPTP